MLMNDLRVIINRLFLERINKIFIGNIKSYLKSQLLFSFSIKIFKK